MDENETRTDWRLLRQQELERRGAQFNAELVELQRKYGLVLKAIIVPLDNGMAAARIIVDLADPVQ